MSLHVVPDILTEPTVGRRVRQGRRLRDLTQLELAQRIGASRESVSAWERGETAITIEVLIEIARAIRLPVALLVDGLDGQGSADGPPTGGGTWAPSDSNRQPADVRPEPHLRAVA